MGLVTLSFAGRAKFFRSLGGCGRVVVFAVPSHIYLAVVVAIEVAVVDVVVIVSVEVVVVVVLLCWSVFSPILP